METTINDRLQIVIEQSGLKKAQFAERVGISAAYVSQMCSGVRIPSPRTISDICREFHIRREWLENGEGPMKYPEPEDGMDLVNRLLENEDDDVVRFVRRFMQSYFELTPDNQAVLRSFLATLMDKD